MVEFQPDGGTGSPSIGYTDDRGRYDLRFSKERWGAIPGRHTVHIRFDNDPRGKEPPPVVIPARYNDRSEIKQDVVAGRQVVNLELSSGRVASSSDQPRKSGNLR